MPEPKKKRTCRICATEHNVGEACPACEWDEERETNRAKGEIEREKIKDELKKGTPPTKKKSAWDI